MSTGLPLPRPAAPKNAASPAETAPDPRTYFSAETLARFDAQVAQVPEARAALIPILHHAQAEKGWLARETILAVAAYLKLPAIRVWETATFYPMFHRAPVGRHVAWVCRNISCDLRGATEIVGAFRRKCGIEPGETTSDGRLTLLLAECLGGCTAAPMMDLDGEYHENLTPESVERILDGLS